MMQHGQNDDTFTTSKERSADDDALSFGFDEAILLEEQLIREGHQEGLRDGEGAGVRQGTEIGFRKGVELCHEIGHYYGATMVWTALVLAHPNNYNSRAIKILEKLKDRIEALQLDAQNETMMDDVEAIRGNYRLVRTMVLPKSVLKAQQEKIPLSF
eukprot:TRINITY_DN3655_c0_g1_i1.p1 TRINITY_DN3655_c0_g1~~TRINITY_DN3655_c0_g1_i1.p1  ORF type:complete len:171 (-),score=42.90 TRINITY_DN3655_c0_g1_i1:252-722(-)